MDAGGAADESADLRTAKSCGPDAPTLASSFAERSRAGEGGKKARSPGRARNKLLKPSRAGMPGDPGATVVTNARAYYLYTRGCGCNGHPAFPAPPWGSATPFVGRSVHAQLWAHRAARMRTCVELSASLELQPRQPCIQATGGDQRRMGALFDDAALVHHHDPVSRTTRWRAGGRSPGSCGCASMPPARPAPASRFRRPGRGRLVQQQQRRVPQDRARDRDALPLSTRQADATFAERRLKPPGRWRMNSVARA